MSPMSLGVPLPYFLAPVAQAECGKTVFTPRNTVQISIVPQRAIERNNGRGRLRLLAEGQPADVDRHTKIFGVLGQRRDVIWAPIAVRAQQTTHHAVLVVVEFFQVHVHSVRHRRQRQHGVFPLIAQTQHQPGAVRNPVLQLRTPARFRRTGGFGLLLEGARRRLSGSRLLGRFFRGRLHRSFRGAFVGHGLEDVAVRGSKPLDHSARLARSTPCATLLNTLGMISGTCLAPAGFRPV